MQQLRIAEDTNESLFSPQNKQKISFPKFPSSIELPINIVFIGLNRSMINTTFLLDKLPHTSQISRYVPLDYRYETFINYSLTYHLYFMDNSFTIDYSNSLAIMGSYAFTTEMGIYWTGRTTSATYYRLSCDSGRDFITNNLNQYSNDQEEQMSMISGSEYTLFFTNLFFNGSQFYHNQTYSPHVYYNEKEDIDTDRVSTLRAEARYSPGFDWPSNRWILLDLSSGPSPYETISAEYTLFNEFFEGLITSQGVSQEILTLSRAVTFSRFVPTYLYEPVWTPNVNISIVVYHDFDFDVTQYIDTNTLTTAFQDLFLTSNVSIQLCYLPINPDDPIYTSLENLNTLTDYVTWASALVDYVSANETQLFGEYDHTLYTRYLCGVFASNVIDANKSDAVERALGYTAGTYGRPHAKGSVVTISPEKVDLWHEGYTQTIIHEIAHATGLRHPHDFRFNNDLYYIWTWDIVSSPLTYLSSNYYFQQFDFDALYRGNYRYLFNQTDYNIDILRTTFFNKNFPDDYFPSSYYDRLGMISDILNDSLNIFTKKNYYTALKNIKSAFLLSQQLVEESSSYINYIPPVINLYTENNSIVDYGETLYVEGKTTSYETPNISLINYNGLTTVCCDQELLFNESFRYETGFSSIISSGTFGRPDLQTPIFILVDDGVQYNYFTLELDFLNLYVRIVSPSVNMHIDISNTPYLPIFGTFRSISNQSRIKIIYGNYWYVEDNKYNQTLWHNVTKLTNNEWIVNASIDYFNNADNNLILVTISNELIERQDQILVKISGIPTNQSSTLPPSTPITTNNPNFNPLKNTWTPTVTEILAIIGILGGTSFFSIKGIKSYNNRRSLKRISNLDVIKRQSVKSKHLDPLSKTVEKVEKKYSDALKSATKKDTSFHLKRRKNY